MKLTFLASLLAFWLILSTSPQRGLRQAQLDETVTPVPTVTTTPTLIPARNLDLLPKFQAISAADYENCQLPCWWGFKKGETTLTEILTFIQENEYDRSWKQSIYANSLSPQEFLRLSEPIVLSFEDSYFDLSSNFSMHFSFDDKDRVNTISIRYGNPGRWLSPEADHVSLPKLLTQIDEIPEIYIAENPSTFRISEYYMIVKFPKTGVEAVYMFDLAKDNPVNVLPDALRLCLDLSRVYFVNISLYINPDREPLPDFYKTPENAYGIGISTEEFVQFFREHPDKCLDIAAYKNNEGDTP